MSTTATSTLTAIVSDPNTRVIVDPTEKDLQTAESTHVFAFSTQGGLLLAESEGDFTMAEWEEAHNVAKQVCCETEKKEGMDMIMDDKKSAGPDMQRFLRSAMEAKVTDDLGWR
jgi:exosome complex component RRP46